MLKPVFRATVIGFFIISMLACSGNTPPNRDTTTLSSLRSLSRSNVKSGGLTGLRYIAIRDTALSLGARGGLAHRSNQINAELKQDARYLERVFNFNAMLLDDNVLPPILIEGRDTLDQASSDIIRLSDRQYIILYQARFVTTAPHWREYLWLDFAKPELPDASLLPKDDNEERVWERYISEGWESGIQQANAIFQENLGRIKRDYQGMVKYRTLLAQGIVSAPFVARTEMGITGNSDEIAVNDRILRITAMPAFETNGAKWDPITSRMLEKAEDPNESSWETPPRFLAPKLTEDLSKCNVKIDKHYSPLLKNNVLSALRDCPND